VAQALAGDLLAWGISVVPVNPGNYKSEIEGPSFQHDVASAARGIVGLLVRQGDGEGGGVSEDSGKWFDWTGAERTS
jgi:hypothetical protein